MRLFYLFIIIVLVLTLNACSKPETQQNKMNIQMTSVKNDLLNEKHGEESYIVVFKEKKDKTLINKLGGEVEHETKNLPIVISHMPEQAKKALEKNPKIERIEKDQKIGLFSEAIDWGIEKTKTQLAWGYPYTGQGVKVAVLDSGIDFSHQDLNIAGGISFVNEDNRDSSIHDYNGHGTHVAGIIGAKHNGLGVMGVAPNSLLYAVKVLDQSGEGYLSDVVAGIDWSITNQMDVINISLGMGEYSEVLETVVNKAYQSGVIVIAAAGNSGNPEGSGDSIEFPARLNNVIAVGATTPKNVRSSFSSTGPNLELSSPGEDILSTYPNNQYAYGSGTSMAAPYVTGVVALLKEAYPNWTNQEIRTHLKATVLDIGNPGFDSNYGYGLVQFQLDKVVPQKPSILQGEAFNGGVELSWESTNDSSTGYFIYINGERFNNLPTFSNKQKISSLTNGKIYSFNVTAVNKEGFESASSETLELKPRIDIFFQDIPNNYWAFHEVAAIGERGWMKGTSANIFSPINGLTRAQAAVILVRALMLEPVTGSVIDFDDIDENHWAKEEIEIIAGHKIMNGKNPDLFAPNDLITREQMAVILYRIFFSDQQVDNNIGFNDINQEHWSFKEINVTTKNKIFAGYLDHTFKPQNALTRIQMAVLMYRISPYFF